MASPSPDRPEVRPPDPAVPPVAWSWVAGVPLVLLAVLLVFVGRYGGHRDELYFAAAGNHLAWGYPDQPALTPFVAHLTQLVAPGSVAALHVASALVTVVTVVLATLTARELGGGRAAQAFTAVVVGTGVGVVILGHMLSTATTDTMFWVAVVYAVVVVLRRDRPRGWVVVGLVAGVGLENKHLVAFLLAGIVAGIVLTPAARHHLRSPWAWAGAGVALLLWLPNLAWQAAHGWPQLTLARDIRAEYGTLDERIGFVVLLLVLLNPLTTAVWVYGLVRLFRRPELATVRPLAWAFVLLTVGFLVVGGKAYYLLGLLGVLVAAGACGLAEHWSTRWLVVGACAIAVTGIAMWPAGLPVLPEPDFADSFYADVNEDQAEMIGWPALVGAVNGVVQDVGADVVVTQNYGEAGALELYGSRADVYSGHNGFGDWGPPPTTASPVVLVGFDVAPTWMTGCRQAATVRTGADNEEDGALVWVCAGPVPSWEKVWPQVRHLSA